MRNGIECRKKAQLDAKPEYNIFCELSPVKPKED